MTVTLTSIKSEAKAALKNKFVVAMIAALTVLFSFLIIENVVWVLSLVIGEVAASFVMLLLTVLLCGPLTLGVFRCFWRMHGGLCEPPAVVFYYFSKITLYHKAIRLCFMLSLKLLLFAAIFYLPALAVYVISSPEIYEFLKMPIPIWSQHLAQLVDFLSTIGAVLTAVSLIKFYLAPILVITDEDMDAEEALHMSAVISKTSLMDFIFLGFSLILWIILSFLFIPLVFTLPYFIMCYVVHAGYSVKDYNERIKKMNDESFPSFVAGA